MKFRIICSIFVRFVLAAALPISFLVVIITWGVGKNVDSNVILLGIILGLGILFKLMKFTYYTVVLDVLDRYSLVEEDVNNNAGELSKKTK